MYMCEKDLRGLLILFSRELNLGEMMEKKVGKLEENEGK